MLDAAAVLILEKGANGMTLDAVSEAASISKGGLLYHFGSKLSLLEALLDSLAEQFVVEVERAAAADPVCNGSLARAYLRTVARLGELPRDRQIWKALTIICTLQPDLFARLSSWLARLSRAEKAQGFDPLEALHLRLVADGLWMADLFDYHEITPERRTALLEKLGVELPAIVVPCRGG